MNGVGKKEKKYKTVCRHVYILSIVYYPPRDVFALNTGKYRPGCIFFVYTGALVLWIMSVNNFRFFNNISESMQLTNIYNISLERSYCSASADVCCIKIHAEMTEILQFLKFLYSVLLMLFDSLVHVFS